MAPASPWQFSQDLAWMAYNHLRRYRAVRSRSSGAPIGVSDRISSDDRDLVRACLKPESERPGHYSRAC